MRIVFVLSLCCFFLLCLPVFGMDSLNSDSVRVVTTARVPGNVPVGTIIAWPITTNPGDNWLECNGQSVNRSVYPELFAVIGSTVPDYRGLFLRGLGGQSAAINVHQKHSTHIPPNEAKASLGGILWQIAGRRMDWGSTNIGYYGLVTGEYNGSSGNPMSLVNSGNTTLPIPISITGTGTETRPDNKAVRYFIRAGP